MQKHVKARDAGKRICLIVIFLWSLFIFIFRESDFFFFFKKSFLSLEILNSRNTEDWYKAL